MKRFFIVGNLLLAALLFGGLYLWEARAQEAAPVSEEKKEEATKKVDLAAALVALGAAIALGLGAVGTGLAQGRIGSAGIGAIAENPKMFAYALLFIAVPETLVIFGFVVAFLLLKSVGMM